MASLFHYDTGAGGGGEEDCQQSWIKKYNFIMQADNIINDWMHKKNLSLLLLVILLTSLNKFSTGKFNMLCTNTVPSQKHVMHDQDMTETEKKIIQQ